MRRWSVDDVCHWLADEPKLDAIAIERFRQLEVDGKRLIGDDDQALLRATGIKSGPLADHLLRCLERLKKNLKAVHSKRGSLVMPHVSTVGVTELELHVPTADGTDIIVRMLDFAGQVTGFFSLSLVFLVLFWVSTTSVMH